jgi:hypothetical protein
MTKKVTTKLAPLEDPKYIGKWVAIASDRSKIMGYGEKLVPLSKEFGNKGVTYTKVPEKGVIYAF